MVFCGLMKDSIQIFQKTFEHYTKRFLFLFCYRTFMTLHPSFGISLGLTVGTMAPFQLSSTLTKKLMDKRCDAG